MVRRKIDARRFSRRQAALGVCLAPAGVVAARWLAACGDAGDGGARAPSGDDGTDEVDGDDDSSREPSSADASDRGNGRSDASTSSARDAAPSSNRDARASADVDDAGLEPDPAVDAASPADARVASANDAGDSAQSGSDASVVDVPWASGGTKSMRGNYPDPFAGGMMGTACALYPAQTLGPCYASPVAAREDISDAVPGLPLRLSFLVVEQDGCTPVPNAEVDIWHTGSNGVYSAFASGICNPDRVDVASQRYCRGKQNTDAMGRVHFSTVFPGWYTGRTIHIHFTVRVGGRAFITSQLYFEDALSDEIMEQVDYKSRGERDTDNRRDSVLRGADLAPFLFSSAKRADGALHAWKVLSVRS